MKDWKNNQYLIKACRCACKQRTLVYSIDSRKGNTVMFEKKENALVLSLAVILQYLIGSIQQFCQEHEKYHDRTGCNHILWYWPYKVKCPRNTHSVACQMNTHRSTQYGINNFLELKVIIQMDRQHISFFIHI